jgi:hypothetical protein
MSRGSTNERAVLHHGLAPAPSRRVHAGHADADSRRDRKPDLALDEIDGDVEVEDCDPAEESADMEPSLGATVDIDQSIAWLATIGETDAEHEHDGREPDADFEPRFEPVFEAG